LLGVVRVDRLRYALDAFEPIPGILRRAATMDAA
jgi:hypothetical protein